MRSRFSLGRPPALREVSCRMCRRADWKAASTHPDLPRTLRWPTTTDVKVAIESHGSSPTSAEAQRRRLAQGRAGSPVTAPVFRGTRDAKPRGRRETLERGLGWRCLCVSARGAIAALSKLLPLTLSYKSLFYGRVYSVAFVGNSFSSGMEHCDAAYRRETLSPGD